MAGYVSINSDGIDAKEIFKRFNTTIFNVSVATGINRAAVTRTMLNKAAPHNIEKVVLYLEEISANDYEFDVKECEERLKKSIEDLQEAWNAYERRECELDEFRKKYGFKRRKERKRKIVVCEMIQRVLKNN